MWLDSPARVHKLRKSGWRGGGFNQKTSCAAPMHGSRQNEGRRGEGGEGREGRGEGGEGEGPVINTKTRSCKKREIWQQ